MQEIEARIVPANLNVRHVPFMENDHLGYRQANVEVMEGVLNDHVAVHPNQRHEAEFSLKS
jgi:hypothetical protein